MNDVITVAQSTFGRFARLKALYFILAICIIDVALMSLYDELTLGMEKELMIDCALAIATVVGFLTAITAAFDVPRELREKTALFILTKPMGRSAFIWGKFLGIGGLCVFNIAIVMAGSLFVIHANYGEFNPAIASAGVLIAGEALVLVGVGLVLSMVLPDVMAALGVFAVFFVGHAVFMVPRVWGNGVVTKAVYYIFPNFYNLDIKTEASSGHALPEGFVVWALVYALGYAIALVALTNVLFSRKDVG